MPKNATSATGRNKIVPAGPLARAAAADVLVSGDSHLLVLRDVVPVMTPAEFLASLANR